MKSAGARIPRSAGSSLGFLHSRTACDGSGRRPTRVPCAPTIGGVSRRLERPTPRRPTAPAAARFGATPVPGRPHTPLWRRAGCVWPGARSDTRLPFHGSAPGTAGTPPRRGAALPGHRRQPTSRLPRRRPHLAELSLEPLLGQSERATREVHLCPCGGDASTVAVPERHAQSDLGTALPANRPRIAARGALEQLTVVEESAPDHEIRRRLAPGAGQPRLGLGQARARQAHLRVALDDRLMNRCALGQSRQFAQRSADRQARQVRAADRDGKRHPRVVTRQCGTRHRQGHARCLRFGLEEVGPIRGADVVELLRYRHALAEQL